MAFGVLLLPQYQQKWRKFRKDILRSVDLAFRVSVLRKTPDEVAQLNGWRLHSIPSGKAILMPA